MFYQIIFFINFRFSLFTDENIPYTDCFLRHKDSHRYIGVWDIDEMILPVVHNSIPEMIDNAKERWRLSHESSTHLNPPTSYLARCSYFFDNLEEKTDPLLITTKQIGNIPGTSYSSKSQNSSAGLIKNEHKIKEKTLKQTNQITVPPYMHMLRHVTRTVQLTSPKTLTKSIHDSDRALGLHGHFALLNLEGKVDRQYDLYDLYPSDEGILAHYRSKCQGEDQSECEEKFRPYLTRDTTLWKYADDIVSNTETVLAKLNL